MTRRPQPSTPWWHSFLGPMAAILIAAIPAGFYFSSTQGATQQRLIDHDVTLAKIETKLQDIKRSDDDARGKIREEFAKRGDETNKNLAELNTRAAVNETKLTQAVVTLEKISNQLETALHPPVLHGAQGR